VKNLLARISNKQTLANKGNNYENSKHKSN